MSPGHALLREMDVESVVVFRALQLGDMLCAVPALRALRGALPRAHIVLAGLPWAGQFASRYARYIDEFIAFPGHPGLPEQAVRAEQLPGFYAAMRERAYTLALQLHGSGEISNRIVADFGARVSAGFGRPQLPVRSTSAMRVLPYPQRGAEPSRLLRLTSWLGAPSLGDELEFPLTQQDGDELQRSEVAAGLVPGGYICIHPGARTRDKCWPAQRFAEVADAIADEFGLATVLTGAANEADLTQAVARHMRTPAIDAAAPISIGAMAALMSGARLLVCNDTGVAHIAAGLRLSSVIIFSKADMERWSPANARRHRCLWDPAGEQAHVVLAHARALLRTDP